MSPSRQIVACHLRGKIAQLEAFADHAEVLAVIPPAHVEQPELFTEFHNEWAAQLRERAAQIREELADIEGQQRLAI